MGEYNNLFGGGGGGGGNSTGLIVAALSCCCCMSLAGFLWYSYRNQDKFEWMQPLWDLFKKKEEETPAPEPAAEPGTDGTTPDGTTPDTTTPDTTTPDTTTPDTTTTDTTTAPDTTTDTGKKCSDGKEWSTSLGKCVCKKPSVWRASVNKCVKCTGNKEWSADAKKCVCKKGYTLDSKKKCVKGGGSKDPKEGKPCGTNRVYKKLADGTLKCQCKQGWTSNDGTANCKRVGKFAPYLASDMAPQAPYYTPSTPYSTAPLPFNEMY